LSLVFDGSVTFSWYFADEQTEATLEVLDRVVREGAFVPPIWRFEVTNGLQISVRRKRIDLDFRDRSLKHLASLDIATDRESEAHAWSASVRLADRHGLTVYDASYLELSERLRLPLATRDAALAKAADGEMIEVIGV